MLINHQQAVINTIEHGLQALLTREQLVHVGCLMLAQRFGHNAETPRQQVHFGGRGERQHHFKVTFANVVRRFGQRLDGGAKTSGNTMCRDKANDQYRDTHQAQYRRNQHCPVARLGLCVVDAFQRFTMLVNQPVTQRIETCGEVVVVAEVDALVMRLVKRL